MSTIPPRNNALSPLVQPGAGQPVDAPIAAGGHFHHETADRQGENDLNQQNIHNQYHKILDTLSKKPAHASHAFPFELNGYNDMALSNENNGWLTLNDTQDNEKGPFEKTAQKAKSLYRLSLDATGNIARDSFWGGVFGLATGVLISAVRFRWGIMEMLNKQKFLGLLMMPGLPILGGVIGAVHGLVTAARQQAIQINEAFRRS